MTQVIVVTHSTLPANTTHWHFITLITSDVLVGHTWDSTNSLNQM